MMSAMHNNSVVPYVVPVSPNPITFQGIDKRKQIIEKCASAAKFDSGLHISHVLLVNLTFESGNLYS